MTHVSKSVNQFPVYLSVLLKKNSHDPFLFLQVAVVYCRPCAQIPARERERKSGWLWGNLVFLHPPSILLLFSLLTYSRARGAAILGPPCIRSLSPLQNIPTPGVLPGNTKEGGVVYVVDHAGQEREKRRTKKKEKNDGAFVVK